MRFEMKMPDLATTESEIRILRWFIEPGEKIERGQPLLEVETDKATMEVESVVSGVLSEVRSQVDEAVSVGQVIAVLEVEGATPAVESGGTGGLPTRASPNTAGQAGSGIRAPAAGMGATGSASAVVSASGTQAASDTRASTPAAPRGVGMFARNRAAAAATLPKAPAIAIPLTVAQRVAGKRLQESKQTIPHFYLQTNVNAAAMIARRKAAEPAKLAWDAFFVLAVAKAMAKFDRFRCRLDGERLVPVESDAIGVAIDQENELYVVPVASPAAKTVEQISDEIRQSVERLRSGDPEARKIRPALMTVTNLGVCDVESFIPVINPPEAAILGIGRVRPTPVVQQNGEIGIEHRAMLTLSVDHRVASGKYAAGFLAAIVKELEAF
jgi:pyruvate dehydrogenase E2 component (dihydrolipoamide acetyltransferase)